MRSGVLRTLRQGVEEAWAELHANLDAGRLNHDLLKRYVELSAVYLAELRARWEVSQ